MYMQQDELNIAIDVRKFLTKYLMITVTYYVIYYPSSMLYFH